MPDSWNILKSECLLCKKCSLSETRQNVVFGVGPQNAKILFIGEAPGENEDLQGEPFVGRGGKLLDKLLSDVELDRHKNIYIANTIKCRPSNNRDPKLQEQQACEHWIKSQISLLKPEIIVCLGRISAMRYIKKDFKVTKEHGVFFDKGDCFFMGTYHPAALLRNPNNKPKVGEDFLKLREQIDLMKIDIAKDYGCD